MRAATSLFLLALSILSMSFANSQTLVQGASAQGTNVSSVSSAFSSSNAAGNTLIVAVRIATTTQTVTVSDSLGNSYTSATSQTQSTDGHQIFIYYARNIAAGSNTVKATFSASNSQALLAVFEYSGLGTVAPLDKTAHAQGSSTAPSSGATSTTSTSSELLFSVLGVPSTYSGTVTAGSSYTLRLSSASSSKAMVEDRAVTATGTYSGTFSSSTSANWSAAIATFVGAPTVSTSSLPSGDQNSSYSTTLSGTGGKSPYSWSILSGSLPAGLSINSSSGVISGTPTATGTSNFIVQCSDANSNPASKSFSIVVNPPLSITTASLPGAKEYSNYSAQLQATGGTSSYTWTVSSGSLPAGLSLSSSTGAISGSPTSTGTSTFTVKVTDSASASATNSFSIVVAAPGVAVSTDVLPKAAVGLDYDTTLQAGAGTPPYTWSITSGSLPSGFSLIPSTGEISGTPTTTGTSSFTVRVQDSSGSVAINTLLISVGNTLSGRAVSSSACSNSNPSISSLSCGLAYTDGNFVACAISTAGNVQVSSMTDNASPADTYQAGAIISGSSGPRLEIWITNPSPSGSATAVTVNLASGTQFDMSCETLVGVDGWDANQNANANSGTSTSPSVSVTTVDNSDWVLAGLVAQGSGLVTGMDVSTTTTGPTATNVGGGLETVYQAIAGSATLNATLSTSEFWAMYGIELSVPPPPVISGISPTSGAPGTSLTVTGSNFLDAGSFGDITINGVVVAPTSWTDSTITLTVPASATSGPVSVSVGGNISNAINFMVLSAPSITSLSPTSGAVGALVTIRGTNFGPSQGTVTFNGTAATVSSWSAMSIATVVPSGATTGNVVVTVNGIASNGVAFTVLPTPSITSLSPTSGAAGALVTIAGTNFGASQGTSTVTFNGTAATVSSWSAMSISAVVPSGATTGNVVVTANGVASNGAAFTVLATPSITSVSPTTGAVGSSVTIAGNNFGTSQGTVKFNGTAVTLITSWSASSIVVVVPNGATTGPVTVIASSVSVIGPSFSVLPAPSITSLSPTSGVVGALVTIAGINFGASQGTSTITFNGTAATVSSWSAMSIAAVVPSGATTGNVVVTVNGVASNGAAFTVLAITLASSANPSSYGGAVTFTATLSASGPTGSVTFMDSGTQIGTGTITGTTATYKTSSLAIGQHSITASWPGNSSYPPLTSSPLLQNVLNTPAVTAWPWPSAITFGQTLASSELIGGSAAVSGTFSWTAPGTIPPTGTPSESVMFTPSDTTDYSSVTGSVAVTVDPAESSASSSSVSYTYDSQGRLYQAQYTTPNGTITVTYSYDSAGNRTSVVTQ